MYNMSRSLASIKDLDPSAAVVNNSTTSLASSLLLIEIIQPKMF
jgi:hypothetical protein